MTKNIKDMIRSAKLPERTVPICLQADLVAEHETAERELEQARDRPGRRLDSGGRVRELSERIAALEKQMAEYTVGFTLRALPRRQWQAFIAEHPPRRTDTGDVDERDKYIGVDVETFFPELIRRSIAAPDLDAEDWRILLGDGEEERARREAAGESVEEGKLTDRQFDDLADAAWGLNRREVDVPFSRAASKTLTSEPG